MRIRRPSVLVLLLAVACGGDDPSSQGPADYFTQLAKVSETAHIQDRGLRRDLRVRLGQAERGEDRLAALEVFADQSARLYRDVVDALEALEPTGDTEAALQGYLTAWQGQLDLMIAVRDAGFAGPIPFLEALEAPAFSDAAAETKAACETLQAAVAPNDPNVDLACEDRPS